MNESGDVGPGGSILFSRVVAIATWNSAPIRRAVRLAKQDGRLIDLTYGYACKWVFFMDSGHVVLGTRRFLPPKEESNDEGEY